MGYRHWIDYSIPCHFKWSSRYCYCLTQTLLWFCSDHFLHSACLEWSLACFPTTGLHSLDCSYHSLSFGSIYCANGLIDFWSETQASIIAPYGWKAVCCSLTDLLGLKKIPALLKGQRLLEIPIKTNYRTNLSINRPIFCFSYFCYQ